MSNVLGIVGGIVIFLLLVLSVRRWTASRRKKELLTLEIKMITAFVSLNVIVNNKQYLGTESKIIKTFRHPTVTMRSGQRIHLIPASVEFLCQTNKGQWFYFGSDEERVKPISEADAKKKLAADPGEYAEIFGAPERA